MSKNLSRTHSRTPSRTLLSKSLICLFALAGATALGALTTPALADDAVVGAQVGAQTSGHLETLDLEEMESLWGGTAKKCFKCGTTRKKCPAQGPDDCNCVSVPVGPFTINKCALSCPGGTGYLACEHTGKETDTCDPNKTTAKHCIGYSWDWGGPGKPASCPSNFNCTTNPGAGSPDTNAGYHNSCA